MKILNKATRAAHTSKLSNKANIQRYSCYPVGDCEFWEDVFKSAKNPKHAQKVLDEMLILEDEPCIDNPRVWRNVCTAKSIAALALQN